MNDIDELAYKVVMARKFGQVLQDSLRAMLEVTQGNRAPTADALTRAINFAQNKARLDSARAGEDFLAECQRGGSLGKWWLGGEEGAL